MLYFIWKDADAKKLLVACESCKEQQPGDWAVQGAGFSSFQAAIEAGKAEYARVQDDGYRLLVVHQYIDTNTLTEAQRAELNA